MRLEYIDTKQKFISTSQVNIGNIISEPVCRNNWYIHHALEDCEAIASYTI
nr:hypothetical protein [Helcococcus sueciensis]